VRRSRGRHVSPARRKPVGVRTLVRHAVSGVGWSWDAANRSPPSMKVFRLLERAGARIAAGRRGPDANVLRRRRTASRKPSWSHLDGRPRGGRAFGGRARTALAHRDRVVDDRRRPRTACAAARSRRSTSSVSHEGARQAAESPRALHAATRGHRRRPGRADPQGPAGDDQVRAACGPSAFEGQAVQKRPLCSPRGTLSRSTREGGSRLAEGLYPGPPNGNLDRKNP